MYWLIAATVLVVLEMTLGTFYLLVIAAALASVGLAEWLLNTSLTFNLAMFASLSLIGIPLARRFQKDRSKRTAVTNRPLDIGQMVMIEKHLHHDIYQVKYRGTIWQAQLESGSAVSGQTAYIHARQANLLHIRTEQVVPTISNQNLDA